MEILGNLQNNEKKLTVNLQTVNAKRLLVPINVFFSLTGWLRWQLLAGSAYPVDGETKRPQALLQGKIEDRCKTTGVAARIAGNTRLLLACDSRPGFWPLTLLV